MIPDSFLYFTLGILTCAFCFLLFRDIIIMHLFKNSQAVQVTPDGLKNIQQVERDLNSKLSTYIRVLIEVREALVILINSLQNTNECHGSLIQLHQTLQSVDKELDELEKMGLVEKEDEK